MTYVLTTYDWVPDFARGFVREIRVRWILEELGRDYRVDTVPVRQKSPAHFARQPFGQVPILQDGKLTLFESGAILLHLAEGTPLLPAGADGALTVQWLIAALNSVEPFAMQWATARFFDKDEAAAARFESALRTRLAQLETALQGRDWLVGDHFTVADLMMADVLRIPGTNGLLDDRPGLARYLNRATGRPAFIRAKADHMAHWEAADTVATL